MRASFEAGVVPGSTVAIKREPIDPMKLGPGGYNTPFYIGDVIGITFVAIRCNGRLCP
jgi:hypothetical protein